MPGSTSSSQRWGPPLKIRDDETPEIRRRRALAGGLYGLLAGSAFAMLAGTIDALIFRDLPIFIDWNAILVQGMGYGLVLAGTGALTGWIPEGWKGITLGAGGLALAMLVYSLSQTNLMLVASFTLFAVMVLPLAAICLPVAIALRWLIDRHTGPGETGVPTRSFSAGKVRAGWLVLLALILGMIPAFFTRTSGKAESSLREMDKLLKNAAAGQINTRFGVRLEQVPALKTHIGMNYAISQRASVISTEGYEILIVFTDGYKATCTVVAYGIGEPYVDRCADGLTHNK